MQLTALPDVTGAEVTHRFVDTGTVRLHVAEAGEGPPLVLLHGWPQHWWCWRHLIPVLARQYRVLAPDLRGWGWSDAPPGAYDKPTFAADVIALLDAEGLERVRVIAHDWGAYTAFLLALEHPERLERVVALDIVPPWPAAARLGPAVLGMLAYQAVVGLPVLGPRTMTASNTFIRTIIRRGSARRAHWTREELDVYAGVLRDPARAAASSACYRTFLMREVRARPRVHPVVEALEVPTQLIMGSDSLLRSLLAPLSVAGLHVSQIAGAGHFLPEEAPRQVLELASPFLADHPV